MKNSGTSQVISQPVLPSNNLLPIDSLSNLSSATITVSFPNISNDLSASTETFNMIPPPPIPPSPHIVSVPKAAEIQPSSLFCDSNYHSDTLLIEAVEPLNQPSVSTLSNTREIMTRSKTGNPTPKQFPDYKLFFARHPLCLLSAVHHEKEPSCYTNAVSHPEWRAAMGRDFDALMENGTWSLCPQPFHKKVVRNKWVFKLKRKSDGSVERYKARLVAKNFDQTLGIDYH